MGTSGYRIEHWHGDEVDLLAEGIEGGDPETILAAYAAQFRAARAGGVVVVVAQPTGVVVARQALWGLAAPESAARAAQGPAPNR